jgi:integrase
LEVAVAVKAMGAQGVGSKHGREMERQWRLYEHHCRLLKVATSPWDINALVMHLTQKCCDAGSATTASNWYSNLRSHARRFQLAPELSPDQEAQMKMHISAMRQKYGVYNEEPAALIWQDLEKAAAAIKDGDPRALKMRTTLLYASLALAVGLRPGELAYTDNEDKRPVRVQDLAIEEPSELYPFGRVHVTLVNRKRSIATGVDKGVPRVFTGEPPSQELNFVEQLKAFIARYRLTAASPIFGSLDKHGFVRLNSDCEAKWLSLNEYGHLMKELTSTTGLHKATPRATRVGRATQMAMDGVAQSVIERSMDHSKKSSRSRSTMYVRTEPDLSAQGRDLTLAARGTRPVAKKAKLV